jgi:hypothetical protein
MGNELSVAPTLDRGRETPPTMRGTPRVLRHLTGKLRLPMPPTAQWCDCRHGGAVLYLSGTGGGQ